MQFKCTKISVQKCYSATRKVDNLYPWRREVCGGLIRGCWNVILSGDRHVLHQFFSSSRTLLYSLLLVTSIKLHPHQATLSLQKSRFGLFSPIHPISVSLIKSASTVSCLRKSASHYDKKNGTRKRAQTRFYVKDNSVGYEPKKMNHVRHIAKQMSCILGSYGLKSQLMTHLHVTSKHQVVCFLLDIKRIWPTNQRNCILQTDKGINVF